jgi:hypothetical protein
MFSLLKSSFSVLKKIILVVIVFFTVISLFAHFINKDKVDIVSSRTNYIAENRKEIYKIINDKNLKKTPEGKITIVLYKSLSCGLLGEACTDNPADGDKNYQKSFFGMVGNIMFLPFSNPPASGVTWAYAGLSNAGFVPKTLAAEGIGMGSIQPFAKIWKIFRDITYLLLVIVLIVIGFMVMFRTKINPQTVISVENSLPKIIIALILITFSFAIAGFMIDLMYLLIAIIVSILSPVYNFTPGIAATGPTNAVELQKYYLSAGLGAVYKGTGKLNESMWWTILLNLPNQILALVPGVSYGVRIIGTSLLMYFGAGVIRTIVLNITQFFGISQIVGSLVGNLEPGGLGASLQLDKLLDGLSVLPAWWISLIIFILIATLLIPMALGVLLWLSLVFVFFRIVLLLFKSYINVLLSVILSPLYILFEAVPGQNAFINWLRKLAGELIVFPLVVGIFVLGSIIADSASSANLAQFPFLIGIDPKSFGYIIGMLLLFMTPDLVKSVRTIFIPKPGILDQAGPGVFFGGVGAATGGAMSAMGQFGSVSLALGALGPTGVFSKIGKKLPFMERLVGPYDRPQKQ